MRKIIIVLIAIIILLAGGIGYAVYQQQRSPALTTPVITNAPEQNPETQVQNPSADAIVSQVQSAYNTAVSYAKGGSRTSQGEVDAIKAYLDPDYYTELARLAMSSPGSDRIFCAQTVPDKVTATLSSTASTATEVFVSAQYGMATTKIIVSADPQTQKITNIACP